MTKNAAMSIDEVVRYELRWYRRLWRWLFPPKQMTAEEIKEAVKILRKHRSR